MRAGMGCLSGGLGPSSETLTASEDKKSRLGRAPRGSLGQRPASCTDPDHPLSDRGRELWAEGSCTGIKGGAPASPLTGCVPWGMSLPVLESHIPHL